MENYQSQNFRVKQLEGLNKLMSKENDELYLNNAIMKVTLVLVLIINLISLFI